MSRPVFIGMPTHDARCAADIVRAIIAAMISEECNFQTQSWSLLARNFNDLLAQAINDGRYRYFVMLHSDIIPQNPKWLTILLDEMESTGAEILSVVSPIKNFRGVTSHAIIDPEEVDHDGIFVVPPINVKRYTMNEIMSLEPTFTNAALVVNSGLMVIDLKAPWIGKVWFEIKDSVIFENGKHKPVTISEDWLFSIRARRAGAKIFSTRKVKILHVGNHGFPNDVIYPDGLIEEGWKQS